MGGRGASLGGTQGTGEATSPRSITPIAGIRTSKPMQEIIDFVKEQTGVDLNKYRGTVTARFDNRNKMSVDWKSMTQIEQNRIASVVQKSQGGYGHIIIRTDSAGNWMKTFSIAARKK